MAKSRGKGEKGRLNSTELEDSRTEEEDVTLQLILISARIQAESEIPPKQKAVYQLSNDIILLLEPSLRSERTAYNFLDQPLTSMNGIQIDRVAFWFWVVKKLVEDLNPSPGYVLTSMKMLRQEISSLADVAVEMLSVQKNLQGQLERMLGRLNSLFSHNEEFFRTKEWSYKLSDRRGQDQSATPGGLKEKFEMWLQNSECVKLTAFESRTLVVQHTTSPDFQSVSLHKISLKCRREFVKSCLGHVHSILRKSCVHSRKTGEDLRRKEQDIRISTDKFRRKFSSLRKNHGFREANCAGLLKESLRSLGLCIYEFTDIVRFIIKLGRFVLLASEHVLRIANGWSHLCDAKNLCQLDVVLEELYESKSFSLFRCFQTKEKKRERKREVINSIFEDYFQQWITAKISTVQVTIPIPHPTANLIFNEEERMGMWVSGEQKAESVGVMADTEILALRSSRELDVKTIMAKICRPSNISVLETTLSTAQKLEEIGIKLSPTVHLDLDPQLNKGKMGGRTCVVERCVTVHVDDELEGNKVLN